jgi:hypothetical protein
MLKPGKRLLKDITDQELYAIVEMSGCYGSKSYWGNFTITRVDRKMFQSTIVIEYEQRRIDDGEKSVTVMFFDYNALEYHVDFRQPYSHSTDREAITAHPKMLLWLLNQDFDLLSMLPERPVSPHYCLLYESIGFVVAQGHCNDLKTDTLKFFGCEKDSREKAEEYIKEKEKEGEYLELFHLVEAQSTDREFSLKNKHYRRMEHCIGLDGGEIKDGLYKAYRNSVTYNECIPEWEDLVRNGYAKRTGELGHCIFYSVTRKGLEAVARRNNIRIRYEIEVNP